MFFYPTSFILLSFSRNFPGGAYFSLGNILFPNKFQYRMLVYESTMCVNLYLTSVRRLKYTDKYICNSTEATTHIILFSCDLFCFKPNKNSIILLNYSIKFQKNEIIFYLLTWKKNGP